MKSMKANHCMRCGQAWVPKIKEPKTCPRCKSQLWKTMGKGTCEKCNKTFSKLTLHYIVKPETVNVCLKCNKEMNKDLEAKK